LGHADNYIPANPLQTPAHIVPEWYMLPFYAILRAVPSFFGTQVWGVLAMFGAIVLLALMPWLDKSPVKSMRYRGPISKIALGIFVITFVMLGFLGLQPATGIYPLLARVFTVVYFAYFLLMPWWSRMDSTKPVPERVTYDAH
jgi:ubiquinol-cytochrome c reductase cytochrome b subunit